MRKKRRRRRRCSKSSKDEKAFIINFYRSPNRNSEETTPKRTKNNGNDTISYLPTKYENESNLPKEELALRLEEIETTKTVCYPTARSTA